MREPGDAPRDPLDHDALERLRAEINIMRHKGHMTLGQVGADAIAAWEKERDDREDLRLLCNRQSSLLTEAANALQGEPPALVLWSHHDIAERILVLRAELDRTKERIADLVVRDPRNSDE